MKKSTILILVLFLIFALQACKNKSQQPIDENLEKTTFEIVQYIKEEINLGVDFSDVRFNLVLPRRLYYDEKEILVSWRSDKRHIINDEGHVTRPLTGSGSEIVILTASFVLGGTIDYKEFVMTVPELPGGELGLLEEAVSNLVLIPDNIVDRDYLILPRVGDFGTHITWETSDPSIISLDGNVVQPNHDETNKTVTLSATLTLGQAMMFKDFSVTVKPNPLTKGVSIDSDDNRILRHVFVDEKIAFLSALLNAQPGDAIILEDGNYYDVNITMMKNGTEEHPIFIMARNPGGAVIMGESQLYVKADFVIVANLTFTNGWPSTDRGAVWLEGNHLRLTNTLIYQFESLGSDYKWISMTGQFHEIDNNTFDGKKTGGALLTIWRDDMSPQFHIIHNNQFKNYEDAGGANGYETIRVGTSHYSQSDAYIVIEENRFESVNGEIEIISSKAGRVLFRNNTFIESLGHITLRHGKNNVVEGNIFLANDLFDTGGVRAYDGGHVIRNNYIEGVNTGSNTRGGIVIHSGVNIPGTNTVLNAQWTSFNMLIESNTIVNSRQSILFDGKYTHATHDPVLKNNIIIAKESWAAFRYDKLPINAHFEENLVYSNTSYAGGGAVPVVPVPMGVTFSTALPTLVRNAQGLMIHPTHGANQLIVIDAKNSGVLWLRTP